MGPTVEVDVEGVRALGRALRAIGEDLGAAGQDADRAWSGAADGSGGFDLGAVARANAGRWRTDLIRIQALVDQVALATEQAAEAYRGVEDNVRRVLAASALVPVVPVLPGPGGGGR